MHYVRDKEGVCVRVRVGGWETERERGGCYCEKTGNSDEREGV